MLKVLLLFIYCSSPLFLLGQNIREEAQEMMDDEQYAEAIHLLLDHVKSEPGDAAAWNQMAYSAEQLNQPFQALRWYTKAIEHDSTIHQYWSRRGRLHNRLQNYSQAVKDLSNAIVIHEENFSDFAERANAYFHLGLYDAAISDYNHILLVTPEDSNTWLQRGVVHHEKGNKAQACADWIQARALGAESAQVYLDKHCGERP